MPFISMMRIFAIISCCINQTRAQEVCTVEEFMDAADIVALCCESVSGLCREAFPATCSHTCARTIVPYIDKCGSMVDSMSDAVFPHFHLSQLPEFAVACRQTLVLYQNAANAGLCTPGDSASGSGLISRVDAVNDACCEQNGHNVCTQGEPEVCDAECAAEFLPYWHQCLDRVSTLGGEMRPFNTLHEACTDGLPQVEVMALYRDVTEMEDSPECTINTSAVVSMTEAKQNARLPTCETDTFSACTEFIAAGLKTCEADFCELCAEAHTCDHSCDLPCAESPAGHSNSGGHYRLLTEEGDHIGGWAASMSDMTATCPLSSFEQRVAAIDDICCRNTGEAVCVDGMPESCPYACGRGWTEFFRDCEPVIDAMFDNAAEFSRLTDRCLQVDPVGMTLALAEAVCFVCGDGIVGGREECDDGADSNSDEPGAACRTNCMSAHCGDGVVDPGEECDDGRSNCDECPCRSDCTHDQTWVLGLSDSYDMGEAAFNNLFHTSSTHIIKRICSGMCEESHGTIFYKRLTQLGTFGPYDSMCCNWMSANNLLHTDFELYSTYADAIAETNGWQTCNYDDPTVGFPRDCGPAGLLGGQWNSVPRGRMQGIEFYIDH